MIALAPTAQRVDSNFLHQIKTLEKECPELEAWKDFGYDTAAVAFQKILQDSMDMETPLFGWYPAYWKRWMQVTDSTIHHYNQTDQPTLFLYGTKDFNIPLENARRLESNLKKDSFELYRLRRLTHYFTTHSDAELAPAVVDTIVHWLQDKELITNLKEQ
jgi:pimeloyl-ACP methyl ester carboxylesterase